MAMMELFTCDARRQKPGLDCVCVCEFEYVLGPAVITPGQYTYIRATKEKHMCALPQANQHVVILIELLCERSALFS
jgi:hypothetical protein